MRLWGLRGQDREVSRSMVALVVSVAAAAALGLAGWLPALLRTDIESVANRRPCAVNLVLGVLAKHVQGPNDRRRVPVEGHFETAASEAQTWAGQPLAGRHPFGVDLDPDDLDVGAHAPQSLVEFDRLHR